MSRLASGGGVAYIARVAADTERLNRIRYRAARRGFLEADLILGRFAERHAAELEPEELDAFERLLEEADQDLYGWIVGLTPTPKAWETPLLAKLKAFRPDAAI